MSYAWGEEEMHANLKGRGLLEETDVDGRKMLKLVLGEKG
jgi:hypothetical protein